MPEDKEHLISLSSLVLGQKARIVAFTFDTEKGERVSEMGFAPGEDLEIVRNASPDNPIEIKIRGYFLSLRKEEADRIKVKLLP